jgi:TIR domain
MTPTVFISHSGEGLAVAKDLAVGLRGRRLSTRLSAEGLAPGAGWADDLEEALRAAHAIVIVIVGRQSHDAATEHEWSAALEASWEDPEKLLIPFVIASLGSSSCIAPW